MGRTVAIVNQKGGVGKTATAVSLGAALAIAERPTLLIDADPQANSTRALGFPEDSERLSLYDVLQGEASLEHVRLVSEDLPHLHLIPSDANLVGAEVELVDAEAREYRLRTFVERYADPYRHILIDCPPSLSLLTINSLVAADTVLIPVQCEYLALEGIRQLVDTIQRVRAALNPVLEIEGILMTMYDERTNLSRQVVQEVRGVFGNRVYETVIPRNIRLGEAPSHGKPIFLYDIRSRGAEAYLELAKEFLRYEEKGIGEGSPQPDPGSATAGSAVDTHSGDAGQRPPTGRHRSDQP